MDTTTPNRRQRIDAAEAGLDRAVIEAAGAEKRKMRAMQELGDSDDHLHVRMQAVDQARAALAEALAYRDPPPPADLPKAPQLDTARDHFAPASNGAAASVDG